MYGRSQKYVQNCPWLPCIAFFIWTVWTQDRDKSTPILLEPNSFDTNMRLIAGSLLLTILAGEYANIKIGNHANLEICKYASS